MRARDATLPWIGKAVALWIRALSPDGAPPSLEALKSASFPDAEKTLIQETERMLVGAILLGMDHAERGLRLADPSPEHTPIPFDEAIRFLKARVSLSKAEWAALEPKLAFRAFTLAKLTQCDYIEAVRGRLVTALEKGEGFEQLWNDVKAIAESDGANIKPGYWETVYRTNIQTSYNAGRRMQFDRSPPAALALMVLEDERTSDICRPLAGLVLPYEHPFWENHWPPFHFNCRTTVRGIYEDEVGKMPAQNIPMKKLRKEFKPQRGFGENPIATDSFWMFTDRMIERATKYKIAEDLYAFYRAVFPPTYAQESTLTFSSVPYQPLREKLVQAFTRAPDPIKTKLIEIQNSIHVTPVYELVDGKLAQFYKNKGVYLHLSQVSEYVIRHEFGHAIDLTNTIAISSDPDFIAAFGQDEQFYRMPPLKDPLTPAHELIRSTSEWIDIPEISDTLSALTKNQIMGKWGHRSSYWERPGARWREAAANGFSVYASGDKTLLRLYKQYFPAMAKFFDKRLQAP